MGLAERLRRMFASPVAVQRDSEGGLLACPCCACLTLPTRGDYELCPVCFWEDDGQDNDDADVVRGGPNGHLSLTQARANYAAFGACDQAFLEKVRSPRAEERPAGSPGAEQPDPERPT